jgi:hypothetical protein
LIVEGNKKKLSDVCPALNKSPVKLPPLVQDNVLPALHQTLCKAHGINKKLAELIADYRKSC